jgi:hypothetical protein
VKFDLSLAAIFQDLHRQLERREIAKERGHAGHFRGGVRQGLSLLLGQRAGKTGCVRVDHVGDLADELAALANVGLRPFRKGRLGRRDRFVELIARSAGTVGQDLLGRGIDHLHGLVASDQFAIDQEHRRFHGIPFKSLFLALPKAAGQLARDAHDATCLTV